MTTLNTLWELDFCRMLVSFPSLWRVSDSSPFHCQPRFRQSKAFHVASPAACISTGNCTLEELHVTQPICSSPPFADGTCRTIHNSTANPVIASPDRRTLLRSRLSINGELYVGGVTHLLGGKVRVGSRWPAVTLVPASGKSAVSWLSDSLAPLHNDYDAVKGKEGAACQRILAIQ